MRLFYSPASPFARKVRVLAFETGQDARIDVSAVNPWEADAALLAANPLGKVPTLICDDGLVLYDSPVICEYLDGLHNGPDLIPHTGAERLRTLRLQALADGVMEAAVLRRMEGLRPAEQQSAHWLALQGDTVTRGLDQLEREAAAWDTRFTIGQIATACVLGYLDFRFPDDNWRAGRPALAAWYDPVSQRESMRRTEPEV